MLIGKMKGVNSVQAFTGFSTISSALGGLNVGDMLAQLFFFLVLLALVTKFAWRPVMDMMKKREDYVANEIDAAEKSRADAEAASKEAEAQLRQMKQETQKIIEDARNAGIKQEQDIIASARQEAERLK